MEPRTFESVLTKSKARFVVYPLSGFLLVVTLSISTIYLTRDHTHNIFLEQQTTTKDEQTTLVLKDSSEQCNLFSGKWVYDNKSYPLYKEQKCSFLPGDLTCQKNGRKDLNYQNWRWQPHDCDLPRFNASAFLEKIRGKRLIFVGDSLNRNQWMSMLCLIESKIPPSSQLLINQHNLSIPIPEYNTTIEFYWSPMLVESDCDDPSHHNARNRTARIESIENHARHWTDADILVFDSYAWWLDQTITLLWGSFESPDAVYKKITMKLRPFEMAMKTWSEWLEFNINRTKTTMFFMSMSPFHAFGEEWGSTKGENCYGETEQILQKKEQSWGSLINREMMQIAESAIDELEKRGVKVQYLNITHLSAIRKEGHPSIYRDYPIPPSKEQLANPSSYADCLHWCLPGVPDVWNQILYSYIMKS